VQREVDRETRDSSYSEPSTNRLGHSLLSGAESVEQKDSGNPTAGDRKLEDSRHGFAGTSGEPERKAAYGRFRHSKNPWQTLGRSARF